MYLSATTHSIEIVTDASATTTEPTFVASFHDITASGMVIPQSSNQGSTAGTTDTTMIPAPGATTTRQVTHISIFNSDSVARTIRVYKDISGTEYNLCTALLQVGDTLEWSRETGWHILSNSLQESIIFTTFTTNGTWTKSAGLKRILVCAVGAGGGGGSGRRFAAGNNRFGGGGGGGGEVVWLSVAAEGLGSTVAVTIGTGGTGGAGILVDDTSGNIGIVGGDTSFGAIVIAKGGNPGGGGGAAGGTIGAGGPIASGNPQYGPFALSGGNGAVGNTVTTSAGATGFIGTTGAPGGGGGGGISNTNVIGVAAMTGGAVYQNGVLIAGPVSGATPNGVANKSVFLHFSTSLTSGYGLGTGGAGGVPAFPNGGNGGLYGAGGGGGSGTLNGTTSGAGGNGANGLIVVMEFY